MVHVAATTADAPTAFGLLVRKYIFKIPIVSSQSTSSHALPGLRSMDMNSMQSPSKTGLSGTVRRHGLHGGPPRIAPPGTHAVSKLQFDAMGHTGSHSGSMLSMDRRDSTVIARQELEASQVELARVTHDLQMTRQQLKHSEQSHSETMKRWSLATWRAQSLEAGLEQAQTDSQKANAQLSAARQASAEQEDKLAQARAECDDLSAQLSAAQAAL